jgi:cell division transport system permease protein
MHESFKLHAVATTMIAYALFLCGAFGLVAYAGTEFVRDFTDLANVSCYMRDGTKVARIFEIKAGLEAEPEVAEIVFVDKETAWQRYLAWNPTAAQAAQQLSNNPLPDALEIKLRADVRTPIRVQSFVQKIDAPEIEAIDYGQAGSLRARAWATGLIGAAALLAVLLVFGAMFVVGNAIQLVMYARRKEISLVHLLGGTRAFVEVPLMMEGALQGLVGALLATVALIGLSRVALSRMAETTGGLVHADLTIPEWLKGAGVLCTVGVLLGVFGALLAARRFRGQAAGQGE